MGINKSKETNQAEKKSLNTKSNNLYFLAGFLILSFLAAFIIGGIIIGRSQDNKQHSSTKAEEQIKLSAQELPVNPDEWQTYNLPVLGLELKLPDKLAENGQWKEQVVNGSDSGSVICFTNKTLESAVCHGEILFIGGSSVDFVEGRGGTFTDLQGFSKVNEKYVIQTTGNNKFELTNAKFREINNLNGVEIIKILGENETSQEAGFPQPGTPGKGYLGAIINTNSEKYPGVAIQLNLDSDISEYEFDQILESLKFTNQ